MIYTDRQFRVSDKQLVKLRKALSIVEDRVSDKPWLKQAEVEAIKSQIRDIEAEMSDYMNLKSARVSLSKSYSLEELPHLLALARIASGLSQTDLARRLEMKPQQVQRYEATDYMGASLTRLIKVSQALGVKTSGTFEGPQQSDGSVFAWSGVDDVVWGKFPSREMIRRNWFDLPRGENLVEKTREYFLRTAGPQFATAVHRKKMRSGNVPNEYSLLAWQARILERARATVDDGTLEPFELDDRWLPDLVRLTSLRDGPKRARDLLARKGIVLVVERHLSGSYLDGAAMLADDETPAVGLTLRYDRLDNFWFVLMHELGHVFLHLFDGLHFDFFDEEGSGETDTIEAEADEFALDALIPKDLWNGCLSRFELSEQAVRMDAQKIGIHPSIIAGRIRKERKNYAILTNLVGQGRVRSQLEEADVVLG